MSRCRNNKQRLFTVISSLHVKYGWMGGHDLLYQAILTGRKSIYISQGPDKSIVLCFLYPSATSPIDWSTRVFLPGLAPVLKASHETVSYWVHQRLTSYILFSIADMLHPFPYRWHVTSFSLSLSCYILFSIADMLHPFLYRWHVTSFSVSLTCYILFCIADMLHPFPCRWHVTSFSLSQSCYILFTIANMLHPFLYRWHVTSFSRSLTCYILFCIADMLHPFLYRWYVTSFFLSQSIFICWQCQWPSLNSSRG